MSHWPVVAHHALNLPALDNGSAFQAFLRSVWQAPVLSADEEYQLASRFQKKNDLEAAHQLVHSYLRLVVSTARDYRNYRLNLSDLVQEGTLGLMQAVKKFDPERGNRLSSYAVWWIRAAIHDFILRSWRMVRIATTQLKRQLFFKLRQAKGSLSQLNWDEANELADKFGTDPTTILEVDARMSGADTSLNQPVLEGDGEMIDLLVDQQPNQEFQLLSAQKKEQMGSLIQQGMDRLNPREKTIISARFLSDQVTTLETLSQQLSISRERVRQIEKRAMEKLKDFFQTVPEAREIVL
ncbi:MAG: RNA polymerase factor sigma-32 [Magnetococcales bacterium]|nr:RNA polymerase factor sigma-32 [Magnetococcales bacterium]